MAITPLRYATARHIVAPYTRYAGYYDEQATPQKRLMVESDAAATATREDGDATYASAIDAAAKRRERHADSHVILHAMPPPLLVAYVETHSRLRHEPTWR